MQELAEEEIERETTQLIEDRSKEVKAKINAAAGQLAEEPKEEDEGRQMYLDKSFQCLKTGTW